MLRRNRNHPSATRAREARELVGVVAAGLLLGGVASVVLRTAGEWIEPEVADAGSTTAQVASPKAGTKPAGGVTATKSISAPAASASAPAASKPAAAAKSGARGKSKAPLAGAVVQSAAHLDDQVAYQYNALGRRDPFQSLISGEYVGSEAGTGAPPDVGGLKVVGIVWGDADQFALVEDARGDSHILRRGDKVMNGFVEVLKRDAMIVNLTLDGQSQSVRVPLTRKGDKNANR
jgi:hypothetical protein